MENVLFQTNDIQPNKTSLDIDKRDHEKIKKNPPRIKNNLNTIQIDRARPVPTQFHKASTENFPLSSHHSTNQNDMFLGDKLTSNEIEPKSKLMYSSKNNANLLQPSKPDNPSINNKFQNCKQKKNCSYSHIVKEDTSFSSKKLCPLQEKGNIAQSNISLNSKDKNSPETLQYNFVYQLVQTMIDDFCAPYNIDHDVKKNFSHIYTQSIITNTDKYYKHFYENSSCSKEINQEKNLTEIKSQAKTAKSDKKQKRFVYTYRYNKYDFPYFEWPSNVFHIKELSDEFGNFTDLSSYEPDIVSLLVLVKQGIESLSIAPFHICLKFVSYLLQYLKNPYGNIIRIHKRLSKLIKKLSILFSSDTYIVVISTLLQALEYIRDLVQFQSSKEIQSNEFQCALSQLIASMDRLVGLNLAFIHLLKLVPNQTQFTTVANIQNFNIFKSSINNLLEQFCNFTNFALFYIYCDPFYYCRYLGIPLGLCIHENFIKQVADQVEEAEQNDPYISSETTSPPSKAFYVSNNSPNPFFSSGKGDGDDKDPRKPSGEDNNSSDDDEKEEEEEEEEKEDKKDKIYSIKYKRNKYPRLRKITMENIKNAARPSIRKAFLQEIQPKVPLPAILPSHRSQILNSLNRFTNFTLSIRKEALNTNPQGEELTKMMNEIQNTIMSLFALNPLPAYSTRTRGVKACHSLIQKLVPHDIVSQKRSPELKGKKLNFKKSNCFEPQIKPTPNAIHNYLLDHPYQENTSMIKHKISWKSPTGATVLSFINSQHKFPYQFQQFLSNYTGIPLNAIKYRRHEALRDSSNRSINHIMENTKTGKIPLTVKRNILARLVESLPNCPRLMSLQAIAVTEFQQRYNLFDYFKYHYPLLQDWCINQKINKLLNNSEKSKQKLKSLFAASPPWIVQLLNSAGIRRYSSSTSTKPINEAYVMVYLQLVSDAMVRYGKELVFNLDETSVRIELSPSKMYNFKDPQKRVKCIIKKSKACFTAVCIVGADGTSYDPLIIAKGTTQNCGKVLKALQDEGYHFKKLHSPTGWMNHDIMLHTLKYVSQLRDSINPKKEAALVLDCFKAHLDPAVKQLAEDSKIRLITVPANGTGMYQTLDVGVFGVLKQKIKHKYREWLEKTIYNPSNEFVVKEGVRRFLDCWKEISKDTILSAWNKIPGLTETYHAKLADFDNEYADILTINSILDPPSYNSHLEEIAQYINTQQQDALKLSLFRAEIYKFNHNQNQFGIGYVNYDNNCDIEKHFENPQIESFFATFDEEEDSSEQTKIISNNSALLSSSKVSREKAPNYENLDDSDDSIDSFHPTRWTKKTIKNSKIKTAALESRSKLQQNSFLQIQIPEEKSLYANLIPNEQSSHNNQLSKSQQIPKDQSHVDNLCHVQKQVISNSKKNIQKEDGIIPQTSPLTTSNEQNSHQLLSQTILVKTPSLSSIIIDSDQNYSGFYNLGHTCYLISILIVLYHTPMFKTLIRNFKSSSSVLDDSFISHIDKLFLDIENHTDESTLHQHELVFCQYLDSNTHVRNIFNDNTQETSAHIINTEQDSAIFYSLLIEEIYKEIPNQVGQEQFKNLLFITYSAVQCSDNVFSTLRTIQTPIFYLYFKDTITSDAGMINSSLTEPIETQRLIIYRLNELPTILCFTFCRFNYQTTGCKIDTPILLSDFIEFTSQAFFPEKKQSIIYQLFAVIVHHGDKLDTGHFYSYIRPNPTSYWYCFNDSLVSKIQTNQINSLPDVQSGCYLSFYRRIE